MFRLLVFVGLFCFCLGSSSCTNMGKNKIAKKPNIILLLADDLGYSDLSMNGSDLYETPNIDKLASQSVTFINAYASHPTCLPSRLAIQTGKYPARLKCVNHSYPQMPLEEVTIAERLKSEGYKTGFIGKWHLGKENYRPINQGYDVNIASNLAGMPASYFYPFKKAKKSNFDVPDLENGTSGDYLTDMITGKAIQFIQNNQSEPFFLNLNYYAVHTPIQGKPNTVTKYKAKVKDGMIQKNPEYAALVEHLDDNVGRIMEALEEIGIAENTIVVFFSDNGGLIDVTSNYPLRDGKGSLYEGGFREPLFIKWPGVSKSGKVCFEPVIGHDLYPTILNMAGISIDEKNNDIDGEDLTPLLSQPQTKLNRNALHWLSFPISVHHLANPNRKPGGAIIMDNWKLIELMETPQGLEHHFELYDLENDPGEQKDLSAEEPEMVAKLKKVMMEWREGVKAPRYNAEMYNVNQE